MICAAISWGSCENWGILALEHHEAGRKLALQKAFPLASATPLPAPGPLSEPEPSGHQC